MRLSELTLYAKKKFSIYEQYKWASFPSFSVLVSPSTNKWVALLMRQKDPISGEIIERCDIKCGEKISSSISVPYLSSPFRMRGRNWIGVIFNKETDPNIVYMLLDESLNLSGQKRFTVVLEEKNDLQDKSYKDVPLNFKKMNQPSIQPDVPKKILQMRHLYEYGDDSFKQKCKNFYVQGKFMEDYKDDFFYDRRVSRYFITYHDLGVKDLRGYFSWRTEIRKGNYKKISTSLAYIYLYELVNGIGVLTAKESLEKMKEFEINYLDSGIGDEGMRKNIHRWILDFGVINDIEPSIVAQYANHEMMKRDKFLTILKKPNEYNSNEIYDALCFFGGKKNLSSFVVRKYEDYGKQLFVEVWKRALEDDSKNVFTLIFGEKETYRWYPLGNAVYFNRKTQISKIYKLNESRSYFFKDGIWREQSYQKLYFDKKRIRGFLRETERMLRLYLKITYPLQKKNEDAWTIPYIESVIATDKHKKIKEAQSIITVDFSNLENIRKNSLETQDSLLTEEDKNHIEKVKKITKKTTQNFDKKKQSIDRSLGNSNSPLSLDNTQKQILLLLLKGESVERLITSMHSMPEVVADSINEILFDQIGDSVVEIDDETIVIVEDYRDELNQILRGDMR